MAASGSKEELITRLRRERAFWEDLVSQVSPERMLQPGAMGDWTFKDFISHMTGWWEKEVMNTRASLAGNAPAAPWPLELEDKDADTINRWIYERDKDRSLDDVLGSSRAVWQDMEDLITSLPERDAMEAGRFAWTNGRALGPGLLDDCTSHLYVEHLEHIRSWIAGG
ncbi:MAG TPA: ClbS/DfsB family four-helix bundle protein [Chloroflexia bacterium]|nr:ClbS/DfsB family four-helix bundle protein [Chloroflexia bacterium]